MNPTILAIDSQTALYAPAVVAAILQAEQLGANATGPQKAEAVIGALSAQLATNSNPNIAGIASLVNLAVFLGNALGALKHKAPAPAAPPK